MIVQITSIVQSCKYSCSNIHMMNEVITILFSGQIYLLRSNESDKIYLHPRKGNTQSINQVWEEKIHKIITTLGGTFTRKDFSTMMQKKKLRNPIHLTIVHQAMKSTRRITLMVLQDVILKPFAIFMIIVLLGMYLKYGTLSSIETLRLSSHGK